MYKVRKFMGLTLFEDAIKDITPEDIEECNKSKKDRKTESVDWVTPTVFTGM
jgi:hypothetical protein